MSISWGHGGVMTSPRHSENVLRSLPWLRGEYRPAQAKRDTCSPPDGFGGLLLPAAAGHGHHRVGRSIHPTDRLRLAAGMTSSSRRIEVQGERDGSWEGGRRDGTEEEFMSRLGQGKSEQDEDEDEEDEVVVL